MDLVLMFLVLEVEVVVLVILLVILEMGLLVILVDLVGGFCGSGGCFGDSCGGSRSGAGGDFTG